MSNSGKVWDIREAYKQIRANTWIEPGNIGLYGGNNPERYVKLLEKYVSETS